MTDTTDSEGIDPTTAAQLDAADSYDGRGEERNYPPAKEPDAMSAVIERQAEAETNPQTGDKYDPDSLYGGQES